MLRRMPSIPPEQHVPARYLVEAQRIAGVTNSRLAAMLGMDQSTISNWRTGKTTLSRSRWMAVLVVLGLPDNWRPVGEDEQ